MHGAWKDLHDIEFGSHAPWVGILMNVFHEVPCNFCNIWIFQQPPPKTLQCNHVSLNFDAMDHGGNLLDQSCIGKHNKKLDIHFIN